MKFRTEIEIAPLGTKIGYENRILALGSCFAEHIAGRLAQAKFRVTANPSGILFNPLSIAAALRSYAGEKPVRHSELGFDGELWFHYGFHGSFSAPEADQALAAMNAARKSGADCHRRPAAEFTRRRLGVDEIVTAFADLMAGPLGGREVILTVSPVRHLGDSLAGNAVSKAALRLAAEELAERFPDVHYFPAYEILNDDLRDYRFYADDLVHPSPQAVEYVWEKFSATVLSEQARRLLPDVRHIVVAAAHRPRNPQSATYREFCRRRLEEIAALPQIDFRTEAEYFRRCIEINS